MSYPQKATIYEVGPRDGLQNEKTPVATDVKVDLINRLATTGLEYIEAAAFVSPKWVPQMADHAEIMSSIDRRPGVVYPVLVPNDKGLASAVEAGADHIAVFAAASETFSQKNINAGIDQSFERFAEVIKRAREHDVKVRGYVSCLAGCPYEGDIDPAKVVEVAARLYDMGCYEISLGDTIGVGTPATIAPMLEAVLKHIPAENLAMHCHDTYGMAIANITEGLRHGISTIDSSVGGLGGCPYAPGAAGNVATEDVVYLLDNMGIENGVYLSQIIDIADFITQKCGRKLSSKTGQAYLAKNKYKDE